MIQIEKNVPLPNDGCLDRKKYPWREMNVGDSFLLEKLTISLGAMNKRLHPMKFIQRKVEGGIRIWRVE